MGTCGVIGIDPSGSSGNINWKVSRTNTGDQYGGHSNKHKPELQSPSAGRVENKSYARCGNYWTGDLLSVGSMGRGQNRG